MYLILFVMDIIDVIFVIDIETSVNTIMMLTKLHFVVFAYQLVLVLVNVNNHVIVFFLPKL